MIIGIDGNEANTEKRVGVNEYAYSILKNLRKLQEKGECNHSLIVYLKESPLPDMPKEMQNFKYVVLKGSRFWILTKLMPRLWLNPEGVNVFFSPSHYTVPFSLVPRVSSIMDLGYLEFSGQFSKKVFWQLKWWSAMSIFVSKHIISISESTKRDIVRHYPFAGKKISVTLLGYDHQKFNTKISENDVRRIKKRYSIVDDYILYLGTLKPSKNIEGLLEAFKKISPDWPKTKLVIAGKKGWLYETIFKKAEELGLNDKIVFTDFFEERFKPAIFRGAKVFAMPSFWEGFGLDVVYAMACGVPVVVSDAGSLPEITGRAGIVVDPRDKDSIAAGIKKVLSADKVEYNKMVERSLLQARRFSWEDCARKTLRILENVQR